MKKSHCHKRGNKIWSFSQVRDRESFPPRLTCGQEERDTCATKHFLVLSGLGQPGGEQTESVPCGSVSGELRQSHKAEATVSVNPEPAHHTHPERRPCTWAPLQKKLLCSHLPRQNKSRHKRLPLGWTPNAHLIKLWGSCIKSISSYF